MNENKLIHRFLDIIEFKNEYQLRTSNIQPQDMYVLERIHFNQKMTIKDLSKQYNIPPSTLTGIIDRLEKKNLIERLRTSADRRSIALEVTQEGKKAIERHLNEDTLFCNNLFNTLDEDKKERLKELLTELVENVNKDNLFADNNTIKQNKEI